MLPAIKNSTVFTEIELIQNYLNKLNFKILIRVYKSLPKNRSSEEVDISFCNNEIC